MGTIFSHSDHQSVSLAPLGDAETAHGFSNSLSGLRVDGKPKNAILGIDNSEEVQQISQTEQASTTPLSTVLLLGAWLCLSFGIVICNKYIISDLHFPYPATLACWHLTAATIITRAIAWTTSLLGDSRQTPLHRREFLLVIFPIGLLFSLSLLLNQLPYISLSIAFIQMLKGLGPAFTLFAAWSLKLETPDLGRCANIGLIVSGVAIATYGEMKFAYSGFIYQILGLLSDGYRIGLTRKLLSGQRRLPPLVAFYHLAPISAMVLAVVAWTTEWRSTNAEKLEMSVLLGLGWQILLGSAVLAFALNMVIMQLVRHPSPIERSC